MQGLLICGLSIPGRWEEATRLQMGGGSEGENGGRSRSICRREEKCKNLEMGGVSVVVEGRGMGICTCEGLGCVDGRGVGV